MAYMISSAANYHWVRRVSAETNTQGVLKIILHGDDDASEEQFNTAEVLIFFTDGEDLVGRLVAAINGAAT